MTAVVSPATPDPTTMRSKVSSGFGHTAWHPKETKPLSAQRKDRRVMDIQTAPMNKSFLSVNLIDKNTVLKYKYYYQRTCQNT